MPPNVFLPRNGAANEKRLRYTDTDNFVSYSVVGEDVEERRREEIE